MDLGFHLASPSTLRSVLLIHARAGPLPIRQLADRDRLSGQANALFFFEKIKGWIKCGLFIKF